MAQGRHYTSDAAPADGRRRGSRRPHRRGEPLPGAAPAGAPDDGTAPSAADAAPPVGSPSAPAPLPGADDQPLVASTFDPETGAHVSTQVPLDSARFGRAWVDPEPEPLVTLPRQYDSDGRGHFVPGEGRSRGLGRPILALFLLVALAAGAAAFVTYGLELWGGKRVPSVAGVTEAAARATLEERGFSVELVQRAVDDGVGFALETDPPSGARLEEGSTVIVYVGIARQIPQVIGMSEAEARRALIEVGATDLEVSYRASDAEEGSVIAVSPSEGSTFTSRDTVALTVAQAFTVPDVVGKIESVAVEEVGAEGLVANVVTVASDEPAGTVVETDPPAGTKLASGAAVELRVASALPTDPLRLVKYFGAAPADVAGYLAEQGFSFEAGHAGAAGEAEVRYGSSQLGTLTFTAEPFARSLDAAAAAAHDNALAAGAPIAGVRWDLAASQLPEGAGQLSDAAVRQVMDRCALKGERDSCNQDTIVVPEGTRKGDTRFTCTYGELNGYAWTVLIVGGASPRASVTCAPRALYDDYDLSGFGGQICSLVAYSDVYAAG